jgi:hypothetical protein
VKRIVSVLLIAMLAVGLWLGPATAMQSETVPCQCNGFVGASFFFNPVLASATQSGNVLPGRCHKDPNCTLSSKPCKSNVQFRLEARPPFAPHFQMLVDGQPWPGDNSNPAVFTAKYDGDIACGNTVLIEIRANDELALTAVVACYDCNQVGG